MRKIVKRVLRGPLRAPLQRAHRNWLINRGTKSYSQEGEDIFLNKIFAAQSVGFYVDVGAYHPIHYSNTFLFYKRGWRGINIDPTPGSKLLFDRQRPRDLNLEMDIGSATGTRPLCVFKNAVLNTFDVATRDSYIAQGWQTTDLPRAIECRIERLDAVLSRHMPPDRQIDFMSIDVEGSEIDVIRSNDWARFRPKTLCVEILRPASMSCITTPSLDC